MNRERAREREKSERFLKRLNRTPTCKMISSLSRPQSRVLIHRVLVEEKRKGEKG